MDRREFLKTSGVAAASATATGSATAVAAGHDATSSLAAPVSLGRAAVPFVLVVPESLAHIEIMTAAHRMAARLETNFDGTRHCTVETCVEGGLEAVSTGRADAYFGLESQHTSAHPAFALLSGLPLGVHMDALMHQAWLTQGDGRDLAQALRAEHGAVAFAAFHTGQSAGLYADRLLDVAADLKGLRVAARGLAGDVLAAMGAEVSTIGDNALKGAVAASRFDAAEPLMAPTTAVAHWSYAPGVTPAGHILTLGMRESTWSLLSPSQRFGIEGVAAEALMQSIGSARLLQATAERIDAWRRWPVHTTFTADLQRDLAAAGVAVVDALGTHDATARRLVDSLRRFRQDAGKDDWSVARALV